MNNYQNYIYLAVVSLTTWACNNYSDENSTTATNISVSDSAITRLAQSSQKQLSKSEQMSYLMTLVKNSESQIKDSSRSGYYSNLSIAFLEEKDTLAFKLFNSKAYDAAFKVGDSLAMAVSHRDLALIFEKAKVQDSAYFHYFTAEKLFDAINDDLNSADMLFKMSQIQAQIRDYIGGEITLTQAIKKYKSLNKEGNLFYCYKLMGILAGDLNEYERALAYFNKAFEYLKNSDVDDFEALTLTNNIGIIYQKQGEYQKALVQFSKVKNGEELHIKSPMLLGRTLSNLSASKLMTKSTTDVLPNLERALKIQDSIQDIYGKAGTTYQLGTYHLMINDTAKALLSFQESKTLAVQVKNNDRCLKNLLMLTKVDTKNALNHALEYITLSENLQDQERRIRDKFARIRFETNEVVAENELLARQRQLWTGIAAAILLLSIAAFIIFNQRAKNQKLKFQQAQQASNQEIFNLMLAQSEKLEEGKQMEQKRISEELHDGVQGRLQGARMMLLGLNNKSDENAVSERKRAITMLKDVQEEVRAISHELSHAAYQKIHNFILSIEDLISMTKKGIDLNIDLTYTDQLDWDALSGDIKINLYRMIQESIQNSVKHAECQKICLDLNADESLIKVSIADDGKGFAVRKGRKGIGMRNIASRIQKVNGTWDIDSTPGKGTKITMLIPIMINGRTALVHTEKEPRNLEKTLNE